MIDIGDLIFNGALLVANTKSWRIFASLAVATAVLVAGELADFNSDSNAVNAVVYFSIAGGFYAVLNLFGRREPPA